jgi:DNA/RNA endonuclease YhcR with UshA esterase domain
MREGKRRLTPKGGWHMFLHTDRVEIAEGTQMKNKRLMLLIGAAGLLLLSGTVFAHHGRSNYDVTQTATVKGVVTEFEWVNPHALIHLDVADETGKIEKWIAETNSPNTLSRQGWNRNTVKTGDHITLTGHRVKGGANYINFSKIKFADGRELSPAIAN